MTASRDLASDAAVCAALTAQHARTFTAASRFLPAEKRRAAFAVYAFCRIADDIVDEGSPAPWYDAHEALERHRIAFLMAFRGEPVGPLFRELAWAMRRFSIPSSPFHALVNTLRGDLAPGEIATWAELARYCGGVASTVGEMCAHVFGVPADAESRAVALAHARTLGVALQLTNILRDVGEDAARGRCYLPTSDLQAFGLAREEILDRTLDPSDGRWRALMRHEIGRARALYADAAPGLDMLDADARCCATMCARGYAEILGAIERRGLDSLRERAHIGSARKALIMFDCWRSTRLPRARARAVETHDRLRLEPLPHESMQP